MSSLRIQLLRSLEVRTANGVVLDLGSPTTRSLFAFLVLKGQQPFDRRRLAFQFWPRGNEQAARRNLRQYLHRLRRALEPADPTGSLILTEGNHVRFCPPEDALIDVDAFEAAATLPSEDLLTAVTLYKGDLLEELYDDWVVLERERLNRLFLECLLRLIDQKEANQQYSDALEYALRYVEADPLQESAYVRLMRLYFAVGDRGQVKETYQRLVDTLQRELEAPPLAETTILYEGLLTGSFGREASPSDGQFTDHGELISAVAGSPFVGRAAELQWLDEGLVAAIDLAGRACFIQGESGVGKSRLIAEWLGRQDDQTLLLSGEAHEFESMIPYGLMAQAVRRGMSAIAGLLHPPPAWMPALLPLVPELPSYYRGYGFPEPGASGGLHLVEALGNLLLSLAGKLPLIFYLDNLHWSDTPSWNFLGYLAQRASKAPIFVIGVARMEEMASERQRLVKSLTHDGRLDSRTLERLSQAETEELVRQLIPHQEIDPRFLKRIYEETEGNPFFTIETIRAVREAGGDWTERMPTDEAGRRPHFAIPLQVQAVIESRLEMLEQESQAALGIAAAIGREFTFELLQEVSQYGTRMLLDELDQWLARGLVRETGEGYDFTHEKLSQVAYLKLSRARRRWVHLQIAERLVARPDEVDPARLAHHYYLSREPARALPFLAKAGERALTVRSYAEAHEFGLRAIGLFGRVPSPAQADLSQRIDLNLQLAQAHAFTGAHNKALEILHETESMAMASGDRKRSARVFHLSSQLFWLRGQVVTAHDYARRTLRYAKELDEQGLHFAALRMLGRVEIVLSNFDDAIAYLLRYASQAEKATPPADLPAIFGYLGVAYARVGSWQRAIDAAQKGLEKADRHLSGAMHIVARMQLAFVYAELRQWDRAYAVVEPAHQLWREEGMTPHAFMLRVVYGRCLVHLGEGRKGPEEILEALKWAEAVNYRVLVHAVYLYLAQAHLHAGMYDLASSTASKAIEMSRAAGNRWSEAVARRTLAEIGMRQAQPDWPNIEAHLIEAMDPLRQIRARPDLARTYLVLRRLYDRAGQVAWAVDCHYRATTIFEELGMEEERRTALGQPAGERSGAVVVPDMELRGPHPQ